MVDANSQKPKISWEFHFPCRCKDDRLYCMKKLTNNVHAYIHNVHTLWLYHREQKKWLYHLPQSQNHCMKTHTYQKPCKLYGGPAGRCEAQLGLLNVSCWPFVSPPPHLTCLMCGESYIYWALRNSFSVHSVAVTQSCDTLVLTVSSSSSSATLAPFFILPWERASCPFFRLSLCLFSD